MADSLAVPRLRGRLHQVAFFFSLPAGTVLVAQAGTALARIAGLVYALSLSALYAASAAYHRVRQTSAARRWLRRVDHSSIFLLIAGTYTPFSLLALGGAWRWVVLSVVWAGAAVGVGFKLATERMSAVGWTLYMVLGWVGVLTLPWIVADLGAGSAVLMLAGGVLYTAGAIILAVRRPDPVPSVFGYHEVWHAMVIAASACHYALVLSLLTRA